MTNTDINKIEKLISAFKHDIKDDFRHQLGIQTENFQHKLDLVVEGHQMLVEKLDRVETRLNTSMDCVEHKLDAVVAKLDAVADDLSAHRKDTEAHRTIYKVKELDE